MIDPITGSLILGGLSAGAGWLSNKTSKKGKWTKQTDQSPEQLQQRAWQRQQGQQQIQNPYKGFEPIAQQAQNTFNQQTIPTLAERFTSMGSGNALSSPSFANQMGQAGQGLSSDLAAMQAQYGMHQQQMGQNLMGMGMGPEWTNVYNPGSETPMSGLFGGLSKGLGQGASSMLGGGIGEIFSKFGRKPAGGQPNQQQQAQQQPNPYYGGGYANYGQPAWQRQIQGGGMY